MRTFTQKPKATQQATSSMPKTSGRAHLGQSRKVNSILHLQRTIGNHAVQRLLPYNSEEREDSSLTNTPARFAHDFSRTPLHITSLTKVQPKLTVSTPGDKYEQEADRMACQVMRLPETKAETPVTPADVSQAPTLSSGVEDLINTFHGGGAPLDQETRAYMEPRFGFDFGKVRIHMGERAADASRLMNARAFTIGQNIMFGAGEYKPETKPGKRLLAHELTHVVQQRSSNLRMVQRDLKAYNKTKTEVPPNLSPGSMISHIITMSAEAPGIRNALSKLIASGKIKEVKSADGDTRWFAAQHHKNVQLGEIRQALKKASYSKADRLARAIYDIHGEFQYANKELTTISPFYNRTTTLGESIETQTERSMTEWEISQAKRVFGNALNYSEVTIADDSILAKTGSAGGYARTVGNTIYFPVGDSRNMALMIHELTHVWQYQTTGWTYAPEALWAQMTEGYNYVESGKTPEQSLKDARVAGKTLYDYNKEQQGDILLDYYRRLQQGKNTSAWQPFLNDI